MKGNKGVSIAAVVITMVFVFTLMASGLPQRAISAVTIDGTKYSIAQYHLYYYNEYYDFLTEHSGEDLTEMGLYTNSRLHRQESPYGMTWDEYFKTGAIDKMVERTVLCNAAEEAGYSLSEEGQEKLQEEHSGVQAATAASGLNKEQDYLQHLYQPGVTVDSYYEEFERGLLADEYKQKLIKEEFTPTEQEVQERADQSESGDAYTADLLVIKLTAPTDRYSEVLEDRQTNNLKTRTENIMSAFEKNTASVKAQISSDAVSADASQEAFQVLVNNFSEEESETGGLHEGVRTGDYSDNVDQWLSGDRQAGDTFVDITDDGEAYIFYYVKKGEQEKIIDAREALIDEAYNSWLEEKKANVAVSENEIGLRIAR
jgi:hypothetical protein